MRSFCMATGNDTPSLVAVTLELESQPMIIFTDHISVITALLQVLKQCPVSGNGHLLVDMDCCCILNPSRLNDEYKNDTQLR